MAASSAIACLATGKGALYIYDASAIAIVLAQLPVTVLDDMQRDESTTLAVQPTLLDGFTAESWCQYAKTKPRIASRLCRESGALKTRISTLEDMQLGRLLQMPAMVRSLSIRCAVRTLGLVRL